MRLVLEYGLKLPTTVVTIVNNFWGFPRFGLLLASVPLSQCQPGSYRAASSSVTHPSSTSGVPELLRLCG